MMSSILSVLLLAGLVSGIPLIDAVKQKNKAAVQALLQKRADVNASEGDGATALHWAAYRDDAEIVDLLIRAGAKVNAANDLKITPLYLASVNGNVAIVERLLKAGAHPEAASETGVTPLMEAARTGSVGAVRALLDYEAKVNVKETDRQQTALMWAAGQKHPEVVKVLIERGADVHAKSGVRRLTVMDSGQRRTKAARDGASQIDVGGSSALLFAAQSGDAESIKLLLNGGANVNDTAGDGKTALVLAAFSHNTAAAQALLEGGADPDAGGAGYTALHAAALRGDLSTVKALLAKGANPNVRLTKGTPVQRFSSHWTLPGTWVGGTPLFVAALYLEVDIVRELLKAGADHTIAIEGGTTPLLAAAGIAVENESRPSDLVRFSIVGEDSPSIPRLEAEVLELARLLLDAGADVNQTNETGDTALHGAAGASMPSVIQLLADKGATLDVKNKEGQTPLALTQPRTGQRGRGPQTPNPAAKAAEELLRKLGASQ